MRKGKLDRHTLNMLSFWQARRHGGLSGPCPPSKSLFAPPKRELCLFKRGLCPKESNRLDGNWSAVRGLRPPKYITPEFVSKNCFFADFTTKAFLFSGHHPTIFMEFFCLVFTLEYERKKQSCPPPLVTLFWRRACISVDRYSKVLL